MGLCSRKGEQEVGIGKTVSIATLHASHASCPVVKTGLGDYVRRFRSPNGLDYEDFIMFFDKRLTFIDKSYIEKQ